MDFNELQKDWELSKAQLSKPKSSLKDLQRQIARNKKARFMFYYGTLITLLSTLLGIGLFFYYVAPVQDLVSRIGVGLMFSGLIIRICIELMSISKAKKISHLDQALQTVHYSIQFHRFRRQIHHVVSPIIIACYTIGFYMITPEFSRYINFWFMVLINSSYVFFGLFLFFFIRKGVQKELQELNEMVKLAKEISEE